MADPAYIVDGVLTDGEAWVGITTTTLGASATTVTFTSTDDGQVGDFSQYMDLVLIASFNNDGNSGGAGQMFFNNDTTSGNYVDQLLYGNGASATATNYGGAVWIGWATNTANLMNANVTEIFDINSGKYKSVMTKWALDKDGSGTVGMDATTWLSQAPITEIDCVYSTGDDFDTGSMFSLFGVLPRMVA